MNKILNQNRTALDSKGFKNSVKSPQNRDLDENIIEDVKWSRLTCEIPDTVHMKLKQVALDKRKSMKEIVSEYLKSALIKDGYLND